MSGHTDPPVFDLAGPLPTGLTVLEASAGTGKTWAISALAVRYLADGVVTAPRLLAITFTHKASADLRSRLYQRLISATDQLENRLAGRAGGGDDPLVDILATGAADLAVARLDRLRQAIGDFDAATVATIHEFCRRAGDWLGPLLGEAVSQTDDDAASAVGDQTIADATLEYLLGGQHDLTAANCTALARSVIEHPELAVEPPSGAASRFALGVRAEYDRRKAAAGIDDYADLALKLVRAIDGPNGAAVTTALADRYHVVLVDEFQDTDPVQWSILRRAFGAGHLVLVGDPKQSIYGFREADTYAYLDAVANADAAFTLPVNHRSDESVVLGVNELFAGADFGQADASIPMRPSAASHTAPRLRSPDDWLRPGLEIRRVAGAPGPWLYDAIDADLVDWVVKALAAKPQLQDDGHWRALQASDIAVLASTNRRGGAINEALRASGVPAVFSGVASVFASEAADEWLTLLEALANPRPDTLRRAMFGRLIGLPLTRLADPDDEAPARWAALLREWRGAGPATILGRLEQQAGLSPRLLRQPDGERLLTDVRHLAELLARQSQSDGSPAGLVVWLRGQRRRAVESGSGDRTRRLETDRPAVNVMTVHSAKGLEFPIVLVPAAADAARHTWASPDYPMIVRQGRQRVIDTRTGGPGQRQRGQAWSDESAAEDRRRLYVALTRASSLAVAWVGDRQATLTQLMATWKGPSPAHVRQTMAGSPSHLAMELPPPPPPAATGAFSRTIDGLWVRTSYSGLTADLHGAVPAGGWDEAGDEEAEPAAPDQTGALSPMDGLPAGAAFGTIVHAVLEACDPASPTLRDDLTMAGDRLREHSVLPGLDTAHLADALAQVLHTPLGPLADGLSLADLGARRRLTELNFELPLGGPDAAGSRRVADLAALFSQPELVPDDPMAGGGLHDYGALLMATPAADRHLRGFLTGSIDNIVELPDHRVFLIDYKTNRLGSPDADPVAAYSRPAMTAAMKNAHYPLQALLYAVALRRYLAWRRPDTAFDEQWAGIGYLFIRGMAGPDTPLSGGSPCGVYSWRPAVGLIEAADAVLRGRP